MAEHVSPDPDYLSDGWKLDREPRNWNPKKPGDAPRGVPLANRVPDESVLLVKVKVSSRVVVLVRGGDEHHHLVKVLFALFLSFGQVHLFRVVRNDALREPLARSVRVKDAGHARVVTGDALVVSVPRVVTDRVRVTVVDVESLSAPGTPRVRNLAPGEKSGDDEEYQSFIQGRA